MLLAANPGRSEVSVRAAWRNTACDVPTVCVPENKD